MPSSRPKPVCHHSIYSGVHPIDVLLLVSATLNLLSLYHDTILARRATSRPVIPPSAHSKYTHAWADRSPQYKWVARALEIIKYLELVFEMTLRRGFRATQKTIWRAIICVEFVKWVSRSIQPSSADTLHLSELFYGSLSSGLRADPQSRHQFPNGKSTQPNSSHLHPHRTDLDRWIPFTSVTTMVNYLHQQVVEIQVPF